LFGALDRVLASAVPEGYTVSVSVTLREVATPPGLVAEVWERFRGRGAAEVHVFPDDIRDRLCPAEDSQRDMPSFRRRVERSGAALLLYTGVRGDHEAPIGSVGCIPT